jgi:hypothetical protein
MNDVLQGGTDFYAALNVIRLADVRLAADPC